MAYARPHVTPRFTAYEGSSRRHKLSLAVRLIDEFTGQQPLGALRVWLKERRAQMTRGQEPIRNLSGYYCFVDLEEGDYTIVVDGRGASVYELRPEPGNPWPSEIELPVTLPFTDPVTGDPLLLDPSLTMVLTPGASYPFRPLATLVRGQVKSGDEDTPASPAPGATLAATYKRATPTLGDPDHTEDFTTQAHADERGFYSLVFKNPSPATQSVDITASFEEVEQTETRTIREGRTMSLNITVP